MATLRLCPLPEVTGAPEQGTGGGRKVRRPQGRPRDQARARVLGSESRAAWLPWPLSVPALPASGRSETRAICPIMLSVFSRAMVLIAHARALASSSGSAGSGSRPGLGNKLRHVGLNGCRVSPDVDAAQRMTQPEVHRFFGSAGRLLWQLGGKVLKLDSAQRLDRSPSTTAIHESAHIFMP